MTNNQTPILPGQPMDTPTETTGDRPQAPPPKAPQPRPASDESEVTYRGNSNDLSALGALASSILLLFTCLTCGSGVYCLPVVPLVLGLIGVLGAKRSVNKEQTQLFSWIGIGTGGLTLLLIAAGFIAYLVLMVFIVFVSRQPYRY
jgi:hypothetical protein